MSISSETRVTPPALGDGVWTDQNFTFKVFDTSDIVVVQTTDDGVESTLTLGTDYTVSLNANQDTSPGGTVTLAVALPAAYLLTITSAVPNTQPTKVTNGGGFYPEVFNRVFDRLTILVQQLRSPLARAIKVPISDGDDITTELPTKTLRANKAAIFDADGNLTVSTDNYEDQAAAAAASASEAAGYRDAAAVNASDASDDAAAAAVSSGTATTQAALAAAYAASAQSAAAQGMYRDVETITYADSPFVPALLQEGTLWRIDTSGGSVVVDLSTLATYGEDMKYAFVKETDDANEVTINAGAGDTINGNASVSISDQYVTLVMVGDKESGSWVSTQQNGTVADGSLGTIKLGGDITAFAKSILQAASSAAVGVLLGLGNAAYLTAGTAALNLVQLTAAGKLPALDASLLTNVPVAAIPYARLTYQVASGSALPTYTAGSWQTVQVNTEVSDTSNIVTLASNAFTPVAGTFRLHSECSAGSSGSTTRYWRYRLRNTTTGTTVFASATNGSTAGGSIQGGPLMGVFTANGTDTYEIQVYSTGSGSMAAGNAISTGENEIGTVVTLEKIGS